MIIQRLNRRAFLVTFLLVIHFLIIHLDTNHAAAHERPNIILIFSDDQRADTLGAWGNDQIDTPNLDSLARRGLSFHGNYNLGGSNGAVCIASRAMLFSARSWTRSPDNLDGIVTFPQRLQEAGYETFHTGKWHNGRPALLRSFETGNNIFEGGMCDHTQVKTSQLRQGKLTPNELTTEFSSELFATGVVNFIRERKDDRPFFASVCFSAPHDPRQPPEPFREKYYNQLPDVPRNFLPQHPFNNGEMILRDEVLAGWPRDPATIQQQLAEYYGMISHMDEQIGHIFAALRETQQWDNTYILFASDHGLALGSHGLLGKQSLYEHSIRSPLIVAGPGVPANGHSDSLTYLLDIGPTILEIAAAPPLEQVDGRSFLPLIQNPQQPGRQQLGFAYRQLMRGIRVNEWKMIVYPERNHIQLFDLKTDPDEQNDLAQNPEHGERIATLTQALQTWQQQMGDTLPLTTTDPQPLEIDLSDRARQPDRWQPQWIIDKYFSQQPPARSADK